LDEIKLVIGNYEGLRPTTGLIILLRIRIALKINSRISKDSKEKITQQKVLEVKETFFANFNHSVTEPESRLQPTVYIETNT
jgi:hypothetical protein